MKRTGFLLMLLTLVLGGSKIYANPCNDDVERLCGHNQPGMGDVGSCMDSKKDEMSYQCREWMKKMDHSLRKLQTACGYPARNYCRDVKPGYNRVKNCLMANFDKLPMDCQTALNEN